jgi:hypothetical protein
MYIVNNKMSKWNFNIGETSNIKENFDADPMIEKIKKIREKKPKFENPKSIDLLETVFDPFTVKEGFEMNGDKFTKGFSEAGQEILAGIEGAKDSLESAFNKISEVTRINKLKNGRKSTKLPKKTIKKHAPNKHNTKSHKHKPHKHNIRKRNTKSHKHKPHKHNIRKRNTKTKHNPHKRNKTRKHK